MSAIRTPARRAGSVVATTREYLLPFAASAGAAALWLTVISAVTAATGSSVIVLALAILPGALLMGISSRERAHWFEYVLVWIGFFTAVPLYGIGLLIGGYGIVVARAWRRRWPANLQSVEG
ncbi:hypothetical protein [Brachybacterium sp. 107]|uniref:hypothetical protein n=1 Tax=Brachybacterium sp. 107 TaxID=3457736 RepID=UPI0040337C95